MATCIASQTTHSWSKQLDPCFQHAQLAVSCPHASEPVAESKASHFWLFSGSCTRAYTQHEHVIACHATNCLDNAVAENCLTTCSMLCQVWHRLVAEGIPLMVALRLSHSGSRRGLQKFKTHRVCCLSSRMCLWPISCQCQLPCLPKLCCNMSATLPAKRRAMSSLNASHFCCFSFSEAGTCSQHGRQAKKGSQEAGKRGRQERQARKAGKAVDARSANTGKPEGKFGHLTSHY